MFVKYITNDSIVIESPAKINLFLEVLNKREDGFHNINSIFQAVSLFDKLEFHIIDEPIIEIKLLNDIDLPLGKDNLIHRAYTFYKSKYNIDRGLSVNLEKNIPVAAGLGGGSSNAAATIIACNLLFNGNLDRQTLVDMGLELGSDVPFFFGNGQAKVTGRGETIEDKQLPHDYHLVLINPGIHISTPESYSELKRGLTNSKLPFSLGTCRTVGEYIILLQQAGNDFEKNAFDSHPELMKIKVFLEQHGAELVRMSGSGPTMFGVFRKKPDLNGASLVSEGDWRVCTVEPITFNVAQKCKGDNRGDYRN